MNTAKPFPIIKRQVWEAYKRVKANQGGAGVDGQTIQAFDEDLENNLYKLWNRLASGSYQPPPVKRVEIPKADGGIRPLGIPTVADRIAQMVVKQVLEPELEKHFHPDSYGYRPGKSAHQAIGQARRRCWDNDWVVDLDIKGFFDNLDQALLMRAVRHHTQDNWVVLYIERWLKAPVQMPDGTRQERNKGTPQGGVISPLLANLYLHYAFDLWMQRTYQSISFERYADDAVCHCRTQAEAEHLKDALERRFADCGLELHPEKTRIIYCKDDDRRGGYPNIGFDFLGVQLSTPEIEKPLGKVLHQLQSGDQQQGSESDPPGSPKLEPAFAQRQGAGRPGADVQREDRRMDQLLRRLLQVGAVPDPEAYRPQTRAVGHPQVQAAARPQTAGGPLAATHCAAAYLAVPALAIAVWTGWIGRAG